MHFHVRIEFLLHQNMMWCLWLWHMPSMEMELRAARSSMEWQQASPERNTGACRRNGSGAMIYDILYVGRCSLIVIYLENIK